MPEFTPPKPPETKYLVSAETFIRALGGQAFPETAGLFVGRNEEFHDQRVLAEIIGFTDDDDEYVVVYEAKIEGAERLDIKTINCNKSLLIYKSILPVLYLLKTTTKEIVFVNSLINGIYVRENSQTGEIDFLDNSYCGYIRINENSQTESVFVLNNSRLDNLRIARKSQCENISSSNSRIGNIAIMHNSQCVGITIDDNSEVRNINIYNNSQCKNISINRNSQCGDITIEKNSQSGGVSLNNGSQCQDIVINSRSQSGDIRIRESQCTTLQIDSNYGGIELYNAFIPQMRITNCFLPSINWQAGTRGELYISDCRINHLALNHTALLKDALFSVVDSFVYIAEMNKLAVQGQLLFTNTQPLTEVFEWKPALKKELTDNKPGDEAGALLKEIYADRLALLEEQENKYNKSVAALKEQFKRLNEKTKVFENNPLWIIANSSLSKTEITGSDLKGFRFEYRDSKILDMFIAGTKMPDGEIEIYETVQSAKTTDDIDFFEQQVAVYSQLKKIFDNQGNIVQSTKYHAKAMEKQQRLLEEVRKKDGKGWRSWLSDEGFDLFNFRLNKWSNNHGESWRRALLFVFVSSLLVYTGYYISLYYKEPFSFDAWERFAGHFFSFLNIARKEDFMPGADHTGGLSLFLSFLGRIVTGFGIYQLIAAFRRHGRK